MYSTHTHTHKVDLIMNLANYPTKTQYNATLFYPGKLRTWRFTFLNQDCCIIFCPRCFSFLTNPQRLKSDTIATFWTKFRVVFFFFLFLLFFFFVCLFFLFSEIFLDYSLINQTGRYITLQSGFYEPISTQEMLQVSRTKIVIRNVFPPT